MPSVPAPRPSITGEESDLTSSRYRLGSAELVSAATRTARSASATAKRKVRHREGRDAGTDFGRFIRMLLKKNMYHSESYAAVVNLSNACRGLCAGGPGNAILLNGIARYANREIGVPGLKADFQASTDAGWRRHRSPGE